ncbi:MAG: hypothetical protein HGGPFJEG_00435 [Ignavibacteria bacterium]|nr:hypothetical protein [Ignavibacteria bacterium]
MRTRQVRPDKLDYEYELYISREHDAIKNTDYILFDFRTKKLFENFHYKINVTPDIDAEKKELSFNVEGLSAPVVDVSKSGYANYTYRFYNFKNSEYKLILYKYNKDKNLFTLKIAGKSVKLISEPKKKFINLITA